MVTLAEIYKRSSLLHGLEIESAHKFFGLNKSLISHCQVVRNASLIEQPSEQMTNFIHFKTCNLFMKIQF